MKFAIKEQLDKNHISMYAFCKKVEISYQTIHRMYHGYTPVIKLDLLEKMCKELNCDLDDLLIFEDPELRERQLKHYLILSESAMVNANSQNQNEISSCD